MRISANVKNYLFHVKYRSSLLEARVPRTLSRVVPAKNARLPPVAPKSTGALAGVQALRDHESNLRRRRVLWRVEISEAAKA